MKKELNRTKACLDKFQELHNVGVMKLNNELSLSNNRANVMKMECRQIDMQL
jgi:hypothetical protein